MNNKLDQFLILAKHPVKFRMFLFLHLPAAFLSSVRITNISSEACSVSVPFSWFTKNPFKSTYFACLSMAAELSTGALVMANTYKRFPGCSMLVIESTANFAKKATTPTIFTCVDGMLIQNAIEKAYLTNLPQSIKVQTKGLNLLNETVAVFSFVWSFKVKASK